MDCMLRIIDGTSRNARRLHRLAQYNLGRAYYEGCKAVAKSEAEAERYIIGSPTQSFAEIVFNEEIVSECWAKIIASAC